MKKTTIILIFGVLILARTAAAVDLNIGFLFGTRSVADDKIQEVYGAGVAFFPSVSLGIGLGFALGAGFEGGYSRQGLIGPYQEATTLKVSGWEFFVARDFPLGMVEPYFRLGYGTYSYKQTIVSDYLADFKVDSSKQTIILAGGIKFFPAKGLSLNAEIKYVPLKVKPYDVEVDLGGWRFMAGLGYHFVL